MRPSGVSRTVRGLAAAEIERLRADDWQIVVERPTQNTGGRFMFSTSAYPTVMDRITLNVIPLGPHELRVVQDAAFISNAGSAFENVHPTQPSQASQERLNVTGANMALECRKEGGG